MEKIKTLKINKERKTIKQKQKRSYLTLWVRECFYEKPYKRVLIKSQKLVKTF